MELRAITRKEYKYLKKLYNKSFPIMERAPFRFIWRMAEKNRAKFLSIFENEKCCGMMYMIPYKDIVYFSYIAIDPEACSHGIGTEVIRESIKMFEGYRIFLTMEPLDPESHNYEERLRRHSIYQRVGFKDLKNKVTEARVIYSLMGIGGEISPEEYIELMDFYMGVLNRKISNIKMLD